MENSENNLFLNSHILDSLSYVGDTDLLEPPSCQELDREQLASEYDFEDFCSCLNCKATKGSAEEVKAEDQCTQKKKRGRRKVYQTEELRKARRAEINRMAAKANRERKQLHIKRLETQVDYLQAELAFCKARLSKYETVENHRNLFGCEIHWSFRRAIQRCSEESNPIAVYVKHASREAFAFIQERCKALEDLTKSIVEISLPSHWRFLYWFANNNVDLLSMMRGFPALREVLEDKEKREGARILQEKILPQIRQAKIKEAFIESVKKVQKLVKMIVRLQKEVQIELINITKQIADHFIINATPASGHMIAQLVYFARNMPEFSDKMVYQLEDSDFSARNEKISVRRVVNSI
eukprot:TRINITY_DN8071_c0_g2_i1.p1 TRINITY_DN8071_c0_g2~~TRINITY_DN8071_c0_g2_i1.p1  ORF type:complete len:353 (+),score=74.28 TRINITY_DN8071_c0_g2_i1:167-1225(+)